MNIKDQIEQMYKDERKTMMNHARRRVGKEAEDVVQEAFCSMYQELGTYCPAVESLERYANRHLGRHTKAAQRAQRLSGMSYSLDSKEDNEQREPSYFLDLTVPLVEEVYLKRFAKCDAETQRMAHLFHDLSYTPLEISTIMKVENRHCRYVLDKLHLLLKEDLAEEILKEGLD